MTWRLTSNYQFIFLLSALVLGSKNIHCVKMIKALHVACRINMPYSIAANIALNWALCWRSDVNSISIVAGDRKLKLVCWHASYA
jgi:hypothetical protein